MKGARVFQIIEVTDRSGGEMATAVNPGDDSRFDLRKGLHLQVTGTVEEDVAGVAGFAAGVRIPSMVIPIPASRDYAAGEPVELAIKFVLLSDLRDAVAPITTEARDA